MRGRQPTVFQPNDQVNEWTLIRYEKGTQSGVDKRIKARWVCQCSCGEIRSVMADNLANGQSKSCGHGKRGGRRGVPVVPANSIFALPGRQYAPLGPWDAA